MNRFILSEIPEQAAKAHNDKHVVKMILEEAQMLCTAHRVLSPDMTDQVSSALYRATHRNHPCSVWVRESKSNYDWAYQLFESLCTEYAFRYGKIHKSWDLAPLLKSAPIGIADIGRTPFPQAMPDYCKKDDAIEAYRVYYINEKHALAKWTLRGQPDWWNVESDSIA
jgi:hypothetical protein